MKSDKLCCPCGWVGDESQLLDSAWNNDKGDGCPKCGETELTTEGGCCDGCGMNVHNDDLQTTPDGDFCPGCVASMSKPLTANVHPVFAGIFQVFMGVSRG